MKQPKQSPYDRVLWSLASLNGKAEWTELRIRTRLKAAELDTVLSELAKKDKISIIPKEIRGQDQYLIILKPG
jgi:hypothetical protein